MNNIPHSGFKAKVLAVCLLVVICGMGLACRFPQSQGAIGSMTSAFFVFAGVLVGARAVHQYSAAGLTERKHGQSGGE